MSALDNTFEELTLLFEQLSEATKVVNRAFRESQNAEQRDKLEISLDQLIVCTTTSLQAFEVFNPNQGRVGVINLKLMYRSLLTNLFLIRTQSLIMKYSR